MLQKIILTFKSIKNLNTFILEFLGLIKQKDLIYYLRNGSKMISRAGSTDTAEIIIINGDLEYPKKYFPQKENLTVIDIGANIGAFSVYLLQSIKTQGYKVFAIEPSKDNFKYLKKNIELNNFKNIKPFQIAISNKSGTAELDISSNYDSYSLSNQKTKGENKTELVNTKTLEDFCSANGIKHIDLLKIDIEGGEYALFEKSIEFIKQITDTVFIELHTVSGIGTIEEFENKYVKNNFSVIDKIMNRTLILKKLI